MRASRIGAMEPNLLLASTTDLSTVLGLIEQFKPALAIVDSAQTNERIFYPEMFYFFKFYNFVHVLLNVVYVILGKIKI